MASLSCTSEVASVISSFIMEKCDPEQKSKSSTSGSREGGMGLVPKGLRRLQKRGEERERG